MNISDFLITLIGAGIGTAIIQIVFQYVASNREHKNRLKLTDYEIYSKNKFTSYQIINEFINICKDYFDNTHLSIIVDKEYSNLNDSDLKQMLAKMNISSSEIDRAIESKKVNNDQYNYLINRYIKIYKIEETKKEYYKLKSTFLNQRLYYSTKSCGYIEEILKILHELLGQFIMYYFQGNEKTQEYLLNTSTLYLSRKKTIEEQIDLLYKEIKKDLFSWDKH